MRCLKSLINRDLLALRSVNIDRELLFVGKNECVERAATGYTNRSGAGFGRPPEGNEAAIPKSKFDNSCSGMLSSLAI